MTAKATKATESLHESANQQMETIAAFNGTAIGLVSKACEAYMNGFAEVNAAAMDFMSARLRRDAELARELAECKDWNAVTNLQQDWSREARRGALELAYRVATAARPLGPVREPQFRQVEAVLGVSLAPVLEKATAPRPARARRARAVTIPKVSKKTIKGRAAKTRSQSKPKTTASRKVPGAARPRLKAIAGK